MKQSLVHLSNLRMWPSSSNFSISFSTFACTWMGILLPFSLIGQRGYLNVVLTTWCIDRPFLSNTFLKSAWNFSFHTSDSSHGIISNSDFVFGAGLCVVVISTLFCRSKPIMQRVFRSVIRNVTSGTSRPADQIFAFSAPNIAIGLLL